MTPLEPQRLSRKATQDELPNILQALVGELSSQNECHSIPGWHLLPAFEIRTEHCVYESIENAGEQGAVKLLVISEENAADLVSLAGSDAYAFDLASYIAGMQIHFAGTEIHYSNEIRVFAAEVLCGQKKRPSLKGRPKSKDAHAKILQYALCRWVEAASDLKLTRSSESKVTKTSACDLVAEAFSKSGIHTTYDQLVNLCHKPNFEEIREISRRTFPTPILQ